jgi:tetratricopeptide (TPR) repeat protein
LKIFLLGMAVVLAGCANGPPLRDYDLPAATVELSDTPFFPQQRYQCGPAALATVLVADGVAVTPDELAPYVYLPERRGSLQAEILAATRRYDRVPYALRPSFDDLLTELTAGTPVLVMMNLGLKLIPQWHYAVVIGYHVPSDSLLLRSGTSERQRMSRSRFQSAWLRADNWAMVAVQPDSPPATAQSGSWLRTANAFEELGQAALAAQAYEAATRRWPDQPLVWQALANARYNLKDLSAADAALRHALQLARSVTAHNNLAHVLHQRGCLAEANVQIGLAESMPDAAAFANVLVRTRAAITASGSLQSVRCSPADDDVNAKVIKDK